MAGFKAGFQAGDILIDINGVQMAYPSDLKKVVPSTGDGVFTVRFVRSGKIQETRVVIQ